MSADWLEVININTINMLAKEENTTILKTKILLPSSLLACFVMCCIVLVKKTIQLKMIVNKAKTSHNIIAITIQFKWYCLINKKVRRDRKKLNSTRCRGSIRRKMLPVFFVCIIRNLAAGLYWLIFLKFYLLCKVKAAKSICGEFANAMDTFNCRLN